MTDFIISTYCTVINRILDNAWAKNVYDEYEHSVAA